MKLNFSFAKFYLAIVVFFKIEKLEYISFYPLLTELSEQKGYNKLACVYKFYSKKSILVIYQFIYSDKFLNSYYKKFYLNKSKVAIKFQKFFSFFHNLSLNLSKSSNWKFFNKKIFKKIPVESFLLYFTLDLFSKLYFFYVVDSSISNIEVKIHLQRKLNCFNSYTQTLILAILVKHWKAKVWYPWIAKLAYNLQKKKLSKTIIYMSLLENQAKNLLEIELNSILYSQNLNK
uniref:Uncharacterized protein orf231 n=1 Tax=Chaetosphaeridium globosum TaxID=96477 RepID=Q8M9X1_CHAGL|nr:hypothetical protein ChglCp051 [Chaetosphaeridium globosum]AAM96589.1 hypothetical protein [Chaetosphaeridium globosum]